jgi:hypothetical protein
LKPFYPCVHKNGTCTGTHHFACTWTLCVPRDPFYVGPLKLCVHRDERFCLRPMKLCAQIRTILRASLGNCACARTPIFVRPCKLCVHIFAIIYVRHWKLCVHRDVKLCVFPWKLNDHRDSILRACLEIFRAQGRTSFRSSLESMLTLTQFFAFVPGNCA